MCGIAGVMFWTDTDRARDARPIAASMTGALRHRGPDGAGVVCVDESGTAAFGHRRLAIIDLTERGAQPMKSATAPVWITFNGEVYNFAALRRELEGLGRSFQSRTDTEVILQGYEEWGDRVIDRLDGMFAFGIYDGRRGRLVLARDRLGIKPLYVYQTADAVLFASEVRALLASGLVARRLDLEALDAYLAYQTTPTPMTLVKDVELLPPGHLSTIDRKGQTSRRSYWDLLESSPAQPDAVGPADARDRVRKLLRRSVAGHLISDVPVAIFLSGGIDSTALVALAREAGADPQTFSVAMPGAAEDEGRFSRLVATRFACRHTEVTLSSDQVAASIPAALASFDHPSGDGINTFVVSRAVRESGVKVALSGLGGDELFGGYPSFARLATLEPYGRWWRRSPPAVRAAAAQAVRSLAPSSVATEKAAAVLETDASWPQAFTVLRQLFGRRERARLLGRRPTGPENDPYVTLLAATAARHPDRGLMSAVSFAEARTYMHDVLLRDSDQMSMAHGLEIRVPLLDHHLVEYVMGLPDDAKRSRRMPKELLVGSVGSLMPKEIVARPKRGFVLPFDAWMRGPLRDLCESQLGLHGRLRLQLCEPAAVDALWRQFLSRDRRVTWSRPWALVALGAWLERHAVTG